MKKLFCFALVLVTLISCMTACNLVQGIKDAISGESESAKNVEEMMNALSENRISDAKSLMHPEVAEKSSASLLQISNYLSGRKLSTIELKSININSSTGTSGKTYQEKSVFYVTLTDGEAVHLSIVYLTDDLGAGFYSFQMILGVI